MERLESRTAAGALLLLACSAGLLVLLIGLGGCYKGRREKGRGKKRRGRRRRPGPRKSWHPSSSYSESDSWASNDEQEERRRSRRRTRRKAPGGGASGKKRTRKKGRSRKGEPNRRPSRRGRRHVLEERSCRRPNLSTTAAEKWELSEKLAQGRIVGVSRTNTPTNEPPCTPKVSGSLKSEPMSKVAQSEQAAQSSAVGESTMTVTQENTQRSQPNRGASVIQLPATQMTMLPTVTAEPGDSEEAKLAQAF